MEEFESVCFTREAGLEKAIEMEDGNFERLKQAFRIAKNPRVKTLAKEAALAALSHKYTLEKAVFEEEVTLHENDLNHGPELELTVMLEDRPLTEDATEQDIMISAVSAKKRIVDFYRKMASQCAGAPMEEMFTTLAEEESDHLAQLETLYEELYMPDM
ncbi:MAG: hypothetical protein K9L59_02920 [Desulfobacterales bacterium]|nr:hypothetical protein [Desulfobacterales bacterium]MCF8078768.1 hypothetical protein [Desulfobacterales bacterium]